MSARIAGPMSGLLWLCIAGVPAAGQAPSGTDVYSTCDDRAGLPADPQFGELAATVAPVFWFSPDEPLLRHRDETGAPRLPMGIPAVGMRVSTALLPSSVYYRVVHVQAEGVGAVGARHPAVARLEDGGAVWRHDGTRERPDTHTD